MPKLYTPGNSNVSVLFKNVDISSRKTANKNLRRGTREQARCGDGALAWESQPCTPLPNSLLSDITMEPWNQLWWEYSHHCNRKRYRSGIFFFFQRVSCNTFISISLGVEYLTMVFFLVTSFIVLFCFSNCVNVSLWENDIVQGIIYGDGGRKNRERGFTLPNIKTNYKTKII